MKSVSSASSSDDLEFARRLAEKLSGGESGAPPEEEGYVRFRANLVAGAPSPAPAARPASTPAPAPIAFSEDEPRGRRWERLVDWCVETAGARATLVVDARGILVAASSSLAPEDAEVYGAHLSHALGTAARMAPETKAPCLTIELDSVVLTGFPVFLADGECLTLGIVGPRTVPSGTRDLIAGTVRRAV